MSLKSFIVASVLIHLVGGVILYFYYNPIQLNPAPTDSIQTQELALKDQEKSLISEKKELTPPPSNKKTSAAVKIPKKKSPQKPIKSPKKKLESEESKELEIPDNSLLQSGVQMIEDFKKETLIKDADVKSGKPNSQKKAIAFSALKQKSGNPSLSYPNFARERGMQGLVSLLFFVDENGLVDKIQLEKSSGYSELDNFVLRVLSRYRFLENQTGWVRYEQSFVLEGEEKEYLRLRQEGLEEKPTSSILKNLPEEQEKIKIEDKAPKIKEDKIEYIDYESLEAN